MNLKMAVAVALTLAGTGAHAASDFVDTAQVISSTPIIERVAEQRQECDPAPAPAPQSGSNILGPVIGGVLGGLLGHQVGRGSGQTAATIVGAAGRAAAGSVIGSRNSAPPAQQCRTVESMREVVNGYDVVYRYNGRDTRVALPYDPGTTLKVGVGVILDEHAADAGREPDRRAYRDAQPLAASAPASDNPGYQYRY